LTPGFLNLNKASGITSHDCVGAVRRLFGLKKVGHGGTLDPEATGVLPIALGRATRLLPYLDPGKAYIAVVRFGLTTRTDDLEGEVLTHTPTDLTLAAIQTVLPKFQGTIAQVPPAFSAIQVQGQRLYHLARQGQTVTAPTRQVMIHRIEVQGWQPGPFPELTLGIDCGPGTYIRAIARDLGATLGCGAVLCSLVRTRSGGFCLNHSLTLEAVKQQLDQGTLPLQPVATALDYLPPVQLEADLARRWCLGQKIPPPGPLQVDVPYRVLNPQGDFLGIGQLREEDEASILKAKMVFQNG
jgi:tRNA pseudouridine55 synthase